MEYRVKTILNKEEIESCQRFSMDHFMWTCLQKPEAYGWMGYLKDQGTCREAGLQRKGSEARLPQFYGYGL